MTETAESSPDLNPRRVRALFYNDLFALLGGVFGSLTPLFVMAWQTRDAPALGAAVLGGLAIMGLGLWLRRPLRRRRWAFFWACITLGILYAALIGWKWTAWEAAGGLDLPRQWGCWSGLVPLAFCWGIGLFLLFRIPREGV